MPNFPRGEHACDLAIERGLVNDIHGDVLSIGNIKAASRQTASPTRCLLVLYTVGVLRGTQLRRTRQYSSVVPVILHCRPRRAGRAAETASSSTA
jgi:hypothetical protein